MVMYHRRLLLAERAHAIAVAVAVHVAADDIVAVAISLILGSRLGGFHKVRHACTQAAIIGIVCKSRDLDEKPH